jgi:hypothetical protein
LVKEFEPFPREGASNLPCSLGVGGKPRHNAERNLIFLKTAQFTGFLEQT